MKISLCVTTYNRTDLLFECFEQVLTDERITEIIVVDDFSTPDVYKKIQDKYWKHPKVRLYRNGRNLGVYHNKKRAVELANNRTIIVFDSDNVITPNYLNVVEHLVDGAMAQTDGCILAPEFAKPHFNYISFSNRIINSSSVKNFIKEKNFDCLMNTMNFVINKSDYLKAFIDSVEPIGSDSISMNYNLLKNGCRIYVVPNLHYEHRVHPGSHYQQNAKASEPMCKAVMDKIAQLS